MFPMFAIRGGNENYQTVDWLMLDVEVKQALGEILTADQLRDCRAKLLRQRLPTVRAFFSDGEVLADLGLDDQSRRSL
jgi:hypothetical protein